MSTTSMMKPISIYCPITRVNEDERTVEGYAFVNEVVNGEGGIRLKRSAMEAATPDYMKYANVRAMHQPIAAGTCEVNWDDTGAFMRAKIVDESEWQKCLHKVYKGFSVGVNPTYMRGKDVESCRWFETSLVDVPKDPGAVFTMVRLDGDAEMECTIEDVEPEVASDTNAEVRMEQEETGDVAAIPEETPELPTKTRVQSYADRKLRDDFFDDAPQAFDLLYNTLVDAIYDSEIDKVKFVCEAIDQFKQDILNMLPSDVPSKERAEVPQLTRFVTPVFNGDNISQFEQEYGDVLPLTRAFIEYQDRIERLDVELAGVTRSLEASKEEVKRLANMPIAERPFKYVGTPEALKREFAANKVDGNVDAASIRAQIEAIKSAPRGRDTTAQKNEAVALLQLEQQLKTLEG